MFSGSPLTGPSDEDGAGVIHPPKGSKKKTGRKAKWSDEALDDFVDIIVNNEYYQRKLIFTNTKNQQNGLIYEKISTELKERCKNRGEIINFSVVQLRNKFKKCVSECKHVAMTIKTATGIKRFQEDKGYSTWFDSLFPLVKTRDSCQPEMAVEPSASSSEPSTSSDVQESDKQEQEAVNKVKQFIPIKKRKTPQKGHVGEAVALLKTAIDQDPTKEFIGFMQEEAEKARQHELEIVKLILNGTNPASTGQHVEPPNTMPLVNEAQHWKPSGYPPVQSNFHHYQHNLQYHPPSPQGFSSALSTDLRMRQDNHTGNEKHFHTL